MESKKIIISGGGTGGHIYPAISIANGIKKEYPSAEILFVGAEGKMEMEKVPKSGYTIVGLPIIGFQRKLSLNTFKFFICLYRSVRKAKKIVREFNPDIAIGVGGYASGPLLRVASKKGVPTLIQEQNSYPGITNKLLAKTVDKICVAYNGLDRWFPKNKIMFTGNPVRQDLINLKQKNIDAFEYFNLNAEKPVVLVLGGSLGARTINQSLAKDWKLLVDSGIQVLWQTGKNGVAYSQKSVPTSENMVVATDFIHRMDYAFSIADLVISRAGASTISELCLVKKPCVFVPSPNVAEDHQTKNAMALKSMGAAEIVSDKQSVENLIPEVLKLYNDIERCQQFSEKIYSFARPNAVNDIVNACCELVK